MSGSDQTFAILDELLGANSCLVECSVDEKPRYRNETSFELLHLELENSRSTKQLKTQVVGMSKYKSINRRDS